MNTCGRCKWWLPNKTFVPDKVPDSAKVTDKMKVHYLDTGTCHYNPPDIDGWPSCKANEFCSEFATK